MKKLVAVIPVRKGSRRLPNKNILDFGASNLLVHKIRQLKKLDEVDEIVVSTDSDEMIEMAKQENVSFQRRPDEYCDERTKSFREVVEYISSSLDTENILWANCVCPLVKIETFKKAIQTFYNLTPDHDSVASSVLIKEYIFDENNKPLNFSPEKHVPTQKLPDWHIITNGFFIAKACDMQKWKFVYGKSPKLVELSKFEAVDIDDNEDLILARQLYKIMDDEL